MIFEIKLTTDKTLKAICQHSIKEFDQFFNVKNADWRPNIFIVPDRKTIDALQGKKTEPWVVGWGYTTRDVYLLSRKKMNKESLHKYTPESYRELLRHEMVHLYVNRVTWPRKVSVPRWLNEGLAIYLSGQIVNRPRPQKLQHFLKPQTPTQLYGESGFAVEYLLHSHGKAKLLKLLKAFSSLASDSQFPQAFQRVYGFPLAAKNFRVEGKRIC